MTVARRAQLGVVVLGLLAAGCSGSSGTPRAAVSSSAPASAGPTALPTRQPTTQPSRAAVSPRPTPTAVALTKDFGYFPVIVSAGPPVRLSFDRAYFLTGTEAEKAAAAHGDETPVPNDYYIVNDNKTLRQVTLAAGVKVIGSLQLNSYAGQSVVEPRPRTVTELLGFLRSDQGPTTGFHLVYGKDGRVTKVEEQYQP